MFALAIQEKMTIKEFMSRSERKVDMKEDVDFFVETFTREVSKLKSPKDLKQVKKILLTTYHTCVSFFILVRPTLAQAQQTLPPEVEDGLYTIQKLLMQISGGLAIICLMLAGTLKMFNIESKAKGWAKQIIYGLIQILMAPVVIWLLITIIKVLLHPIAPVSKYY